MPVYFAKCYMKFTFLEFKAEALYLADRISEALEVLNEAEALAERFEQRWWSAELHRLRGVDYGRR
jgi:predicted ATPase